MPQSTTSRTTILTVSALFIALTAVCSWISVPVPGTAVPINLATFAVILTGTILGSRQGAFTMLVFLLLGAAGLPVFHGLTGGLGILTGPTGGFLAGYVTLAAVTGLYRKFHRPSAVLFALLCLAGETILYALGVLWFMHLSGSGIAAAVAACVLPFLPGDLLKCALAWIITGRLRRILNI